MASDANRDESPSVARSSNMSCPLCDDDRKRRSWLGSVFYNGREFPFAQCRSCDSLYCDPMPTDEILSEMYGIDAKPYWETDEDEQGHQEQSPVIDLLRSLGSGTFVDYGCGFGSVLQAARSEGWNAIGVEFDPKMADFVQARTGISVIAGASILRPEQKHIADVLFLGDVIEHLTKMDRQIPDILELIKPGGYLVATGPLEGNASLFNLIVRLVRLARRRWHRTEMAPRHVMLATARGQRALFNRFGIKEIKFSVSEVSWPAPARLSARDLGSPRQVVMFVTSLTSRMVSKLNSKNWGNRYFYFGRIEY